MWASMAMASRIACTLRSRRSSSPPSRPIQSLGIRVCAAALAVVMGTWCTTGAAGAECIHDEEYVHWLGSGLIGLL